MKPYLYTQDLSVGYGGKALISQIGLQVHRGEILTLIGPNGAGKSTILKSLSRQLSLVAGAVYLDGQSIEKMSGNAMAQRLALVTTERIDPERMTCRDVVSSGRYPYTGRLGILSESDRAIAQDALAQVHGADLAELPFACISDGQRQRILLARALCQQPDVILLDEPTSFLDIRHKLELLDILKRLVRTQQLAVVLSLHELDLAQKISDTVVCLHDNKIERVGPPEEVFVEDYIRQLYGLTTGSYNAQFGCVELARVIGAPKVFVIGGGGSGISVYRKLQRQGIAFAAGILWENDLDYPVAKALAAELIAGKAYRPIDEKTMEQALFTMRQCEKVVCALPEFGAYNEENHRLWLAAQAEGKQTVTTI